MTTRRLVSLWLLTAVLIAAAGVRLYRIQAQSIWFDEGWSAYAAVQPTLAAAIAADATNPPLYYVLLNIAARGFGDSELALRWFSALLGLLAVPLGFQLGRRLFNRRAGEYAALLTAFSAPLWWASQEARMYTLLAVLILLAALAFHRLLARPDRLAWAALWASQVALLYAHNTGPVVALWLNAAVLVVWVARRSPRNPGWIPWLAGQALVGLVWSPWFITRFLLLPAANSAVVSAPGLDFDTLSRMWQSLWIGPWAMVGHEPILMALAALFFVVAVIVIPWRRAAARWLMLHSLLLSSGLLLGLAVLGNELHGRYLVMIAPLPLVALGAGIARLRARTASALLMVFAVGFAVNAGRAMPNPAYGHDDVRAMVGYYAAHLTAEDSVLAWSYADRYDLAYYWERLGVRARRVTLPEGADLEAVLPLLPTSGDVALNIWYTQRADFRGMMSCVLGNGAVNPPDTFTVYGMSTAVYRAPELRLPLVHPLAASTSPAEVLAVGALRPETADRALCLPVQIALNRALEVELKAAIVVLNSFGWEIARADAVFADAAQRTSARLAAGDRLTAYPLVRLPVGAPAGTYRVVLRIYDERDQPSGYDFADPLRKDLTLGDWTIEPGADWLAVNRDTDLPIRVDVPAGADVRLVAHNLSDALVRTGDEFRLTLLWQGRGVPPTLALTADGADWQMNIPPASAQAADGLLLDWRVFRLPLDAAGFNRAALRMPDGTALATYTIEQVPTLLDEPPFAAPVGVALPGVGTLVGYDPALDGVDRGQPITLTLVWRADSTPTISYTVFVQLVADDGRVLAQSDAIPAGLSRPTTGWRPGEYILDEHTLQFHADAAPGAARLIAGMYDATSGQRIAVQPGVDFITLQESILVR